MPFEEPPPTVGNRARIGRRGSMSFDLHKYRCRFTRLLLESFYRNIKHLHLCDRKEYTYSILEKHTNIEPRDGA